MAGNGYGQEQQSWWDLQGDPTQFRDPADNQYATLAAPPFDLSQTSEGSGGFTGHAQDPFGGFNTVPDSATANPGGFGAPPPAYASNPNAPQFTPLATPEALQSAYAAPTWTGGQFATPTKPTALQTPFAAPTQAQLEASPGYQSRLAAGLLAGNRSAAARGTVLNGGTQKALNRYGQDYASNEYGNLFGQAVTTRGIADQEYGADVNNAANQFGTNFSVFQTGAQNSLNARQQNAGEFQTASNNNQQNYQNRYNSYLNENARTLNDYLQNYNIQHTADQDYTQRQQFTQTLGEKAAADTRVA
jgi:hypothetical protein